MADKKEDKYPKYSETVAEMLLNGGKFLWMGKKPMFKHDIADMIDEMFRERLKNVFPWLGTKAEDIGGADTINELDELYKALGGTKE